MQLTVVVSALIISILFLIQLPSFGLDGRKGEPACTFMQFDKHLLNKISVQCNNPIVVFLDPEVHR